MSALAVFRVRWVLAFLVGVSTTATATATATAGAGEYYRPNPQARFLGFNQGNVGSCEAEAEVGALESVFASLNLSVRLSTFYRHAKNWQGSKGDKWVTTMLRYNDADNALLTKTGALIPDYMWPETGEGFDMQRSGVRPHVSEAAAIDPELPTAESLGFTRTYLSFKAGHSNTSTPDQMKAAVAAGKAVVLQMHSSLFRHLSWDPQTGLLSQAYGLDALNAVVSDDTRHALAVVGFDDSLYSGPGYRVPGAVLIRNSWNDADALASAKYGPFPRETEAALRSFRYRLNSRKNLPGYYAIPYEYLLALQSAGKGGYTVLTLDYHRYAEVYDRFLPRYRTFVLPFVCERPVFGTALMSTRARRQVAWLGEALRKLEGIDRGSPEWNRTNLEIQKLAAMEARPRAANRGMPALFSYATLSANVFTRTDRAADFYLGKFTDYYCKAPRAPGTKGTGAWPYSSHFSAREMSRAYSALSATPHSPNAWFSFLKGLYIQGAHDVFE